jgi:uncharacterized protein (TIGR03067 family)
MKAVVWSSICAIVVAVGPLGAGDKGKDDKFDPSKLVGTWTYVSGVENGKKLDADHFKKAKVVISKETLTLKAEKDADTFVMTYELDTKASPITIKLTIKEGPQGVGAKSTGIIELKGDDLKICYDPSGKETPKTFEAKEGSNFHCFVLKRAK